MQWYDKSFQDLSVKQLYLIYKLRAEVFNGEQKCMVPDPDQADPLAHHVFALEDGQVAAYARYFPIDDQTVTFGRVVVAQNYRHQGLGTDLVTKVMEGIRHNYPGRLIQIHAQYYIRKLYQQLGFTAVGHVFLEVGIKHIVMTHPAL